MTVSVNNKQQELTDNATVSQALQIMGFTSFKGMAVAINNNIIKKEEWDSYCLKLHDVVVLVRASQGG